MSSPEDISRQAAEGIFHTWWDENAKRWYSEVDIPDLVVLEPTESQNCWIFTVATRQFLETSDSNYVLFGGAGPIVVSKRDRSVTVLRSNTAPHVAVAEWEALQEPNKQ
jgi:hypothetical protein